LNRQARHKRFSIAPLFNLLLLASSPAITPGFSFAGLFVCRAFRLVAYFEICDWPISARNPKSATGHIANKRDFIRDLVVQYWNAS
jgi:hypothetical protein